MISIIVRNTKDMYMTTYLVRHTSASSPKSGNSSREIPTLMFMTSTWISWWWMLKRKLGVSRATMICMKRLASMMIRASLFSIGVLMSTHWHCTHTHTHTHTETEAQAIVQLPKFEVHDLAVTNTRLKLSSQYCKLIVTAFNYIYKQLLLSYIIYCTYTLP